MWQILGPSRSILLLLLALGGYCTYRSVLDYGDDHDSQRTRMAAQLSRQAALALPIPPGRPVLAIAPVNGDFNGIVAKQLRLALEKQNATIVDLAPWDAFIPTQMKWSIEMTPERAAGIAHSRKIPYLVTCRVTDWTTDPAWAQDLSVQLSFVDVEQSVIQYEHEFTLADYEKSPSDRSSGHLISVKGSEGEPATIAEVKSTTVSANARMLWFVAWLLCGLALPWLGSSIIKTAIRSHSNLLGFALAAAYLSLIAGTGWLTWGRFEPSWVIAIILAIMSSAWLGYLEFVCRWTSDRLEFR